MTRTRAAVALLTALAGCGYSTVYPVFQPGGGFDTGPLPPTGSEPVIPCGQDGPVGWLTIGNQYFEPIVMSEVAPSTCEEVDIVLLDVGDTWESSVVTGHTWVAREVDGTFIKMFSVFLGAYTDQVESVP